MFVLIGEVKTVRQENEDRYSLAQTGAKVRGTPPLKVTLRKILRPPCERCSVGFVVLFPDSTNGYLKRCQNCGLKSRGLN